MPRSVCWTIAYQTSPQWISYGAWTIICERGRRVCVIACRRALVRTTTALFRALPRQRYPIAGPHADVFAAPAAGGRRHAPSWLASGHRFVNAYQNNLEFRAEVVKGITNRNGGGAVDSVVGNGFLPSGTSKLCFSLAPPLSLN